MRKRRAALRHIDNGPSVGRPTWCEMLNGNAGSETSDLKLWIEPVTAVGTTNRRPRAVCERLTTSASAARKPRCSHQTKTDRSQLGMPLVVTSPPALWEG